MNSSETDIGKIRVALVITELNVGGAERCLVNLATGLDRTRFAPQVYALGPPPTVGQSQLVEQLASADVPTHFLAAESIWQVRAALLGLRQQLCEQSPHLIQTFLFHANVLGCWAARHRQLVSAAVVGGIRVADPRKGRMWLERLALQRAAKVICVSDSVANFAADHSQDQD